MIQNERGDFLPLVFIVMCLYMGKFATNKSIKLLIMKKVFLLLLIAAFLPLTSVVAQSNDPTPNPDLVIPIKPFKPQPPIKPRSIVEPDIEAYYSNGAITIVFNADLGEADIVVTNLTTGDAWSESVEGMGNTSIMLSDDAGYYTITIYTEAGDYYGEFEL